MPDAFVLRAGGGSTGLSSNNAIIHVTSPAGSTITFTKGGVVTKVLGPEKSHINAADSTLADWYYAVVPSNYGTWTVTATRELDTASETITVDSNKEYDLKVDYNFYFIRNGVILESYTIVGTTGTFTDEDGAIKYTVNGYYKESLCYFRTNAHKYNSFVMDIRTSRVYRGTDGERTPYIAILTSPPTSTQPSPPTYTRLTSGTGMVDVPENTFTLDISNISRGDANLYFNIHCGNDTPAWLVIENLYLAK